MSKNVKASDVKLIPIDKIHILNPRVRNQKIFKDIVANQAKFEELQVLIDQIADVWLAREKVLG